VIDWGVVSMAGADPVGGAGVNVTPSALVALANTAEQVAESVATGRQAGGQVQLSTAAYGQFCQILPALIHPVQDRAIAAMGDADEALRESASSLRAAAQLFTGLDQGAAASYDSFGGQP
jgi:hypothetical protein